MHILTSLLFFSVFLASAMFFRATWVSSRDRIACALIGNAPASARYIHIQIVKGPVARCNAAAMPAPIIAPAVKPIILSHARFNRNLGDMQNRGYALAA